METRAYFLHALSPLHAGTGQSADAVDLPIARMKATGIPFVPGSSIKGVLRDSHRDPANPIHNSPDSKAIFGPEVAANEDRSDNAGALVVSDARLFALPVRSFKGTFGYVTSPLLLMQAARDLQDVGVKKIPNIPSIAGFGARVPNLNGNTESYLHHNGKLYLEDIDLTLKDDEVVKAWAELLASAIAPSTPELVTRRFVVVDDETMTFLWESATQVETRIRLDPERRSVAKRALWVEECLPPETVLVGLLAADRDRSKRNGSDPLTPLAILDKVLPISSNGTPPKVLQFGGKATIGRGRCRVLPIS